MIQNLLNFTGDIFTSRFIINLLFMALVMATYYRVNKNSQYLFNFIIFNVLIFFASSFLSDTKLETGFAFGLFAILSILRYRTEPVPIKEMTYMFTSIILGTINSTVTQNLPYNKILFANGAIVLIIFLLELLWIKNYKPSQKILFERIELLHEDRREELIQLLEERMGCHISHIEVGTVDFLKDTATINIYTE
ncbi:MAG: DUF4956 domain-containing protein [Spirochaetales bacterium]|nr:DUF4956 domain-containing protein [Spirochaetales bacterium]